MATGSMVQFPIPGPQHPDGRLATGIYIQHDLPPQSITPQLADAISGQVVEALCQALTPGILKRIALGIFEKLAGTLSPKDWSVILQRIQVSAKVAPGQAVRTQVKAPPEDDPISKDPKFIGWIRDNLGPEIQSADSSEAWEALLKRRSGPDPFEETEGGNKDA